MQMESCRKFFIHGDFTFSFELKVRLKWYFSRPDWKVVGVEGPRNDTRVPLMAKYSVNGTTVPVNFFNYDPIEPTNHILWPLR